MTRDAVGRAFRKTSATRSALAVVAAIIVSGCGGGEEEHVFTAADAARIASVGPVTPGSNWPTSPEKPGPSDSSTDSNPADPLLVEFEKRTADLVDIGEAGNKWRDDDKLGNLYAGVFLDSGTAEADLVPSTSR